MSKKSKIFYTDNYIRNILYETKSIAIVGLSADENRLVILLQNIFKREAIRLFPLIQKQKKKNS